MTTSRLVLVLCCSSWAILPAAGAALEIDEDPYRWIKWHAWLMWISFGFLMPLGTLVVRFTRQAERSREDGAKKAEMIFYAHLVIQSMAFLVSISSAVVAFSRFSNQFLHTHQRLGMALWGLAWLQPFVGLIRPNKGVKARGVWFCLHWLLGTGTIILGFFNIYNGLRIYELITQKSQKVLNVLFSIQISIMTAVYLLQDKWSYVRAQCKPETDSSCSISKHSSASQLQMLRQYSVSSHRRHYSAA